MTPANSVALAIEFGLRTIGIWPDMSYAWLYRCVWIVTTSIVQTCQYWYIIMHVETDDLSHLMDGLSVTIEYTVMFLKFIILWLNSRVNCRSILYDVLATMATDWREAAAVGEVSTMTSKANLSRRFANVIIGLHSAAAFSYGIGVLVGQSDDYDADGKPVREFTLKMQLPFECNESPLYELVMCLEFLHQLASSAVTGTMNSLIITLILHASGQIDILCDALREISPESTNNQQHLAVSVARKLIGRHQKIIAFSNEIETVFCYIALAQFLSSTLVICCLGFMIVTSIGGAQDSDIDTSALMKAVVFYVAAAVEAFIFCFCGEYLSAKSKAIGDAAYKSLWYNLRPSESKIILLVMIRSQRRLTITAGKIMDLSLEGFTSIIKASVSYISVLHAMY